MGLLIKRILVTGGAGFLGSHFWEKLWGRAMMWLESTVASQPDRA